MAKDFVKLSEVTVLEEVSDTASVLVEQNGEIYRAPKTQVGGAGGVKTAIIRDSEYLNAIAGVQTMITDAPVLTYECINMTFEEAYETMANGEPLIVVDMLTKELARCGLCYAIFGGTFTFGVPCIILRGDTTLFWTTDGLSTEEPSQPK